jgi:predicted DNA-binding protein (MmcQ/YjbR family)
MPISDFGIKILFRNPKSAFRNSHSTFQNPIMDIETFRNYCLAKKGVTESFPFDEVTLVFKVLNKMFALTGLDEADFKVNLKCAPEYAIALREQYDAIQPGWHMNKKHWNTVDFSADLDNKLLYELIDMSYDLAVKGLKKSEKAALEDC